MSTWALLGLVLVVIVLVSAARGSVRVNRREVSDFEARLRPVPGVPAADGAWGKAEREEWEGGDAEFEAFVRGLDLPDGSEVEFVVGSVVLGRVAVERGKVRLEFDSRHGAEVPPIAAGQVLEIRHAGNALVRGEFRPD